MWKIQKIHPLKLKTVLVTGACGFIGGHIVDVLLENEYKVTGIDLPKEPPLWYSPKAEYYSGDITDLASVSYAFRLSEPDFVIHCAGIVGTTETWDYVEKTIDVNIKGSVNIYKFCAKHKSTVLIPDAGNRWFSPYTITRQCASEFALAYGNKYNFNVINLILCNVYGPRQDTKIVKIIPKFIEKSLNDENIVVFGEHQVDLIHVRDVARAFLSSMDNVKDLNQVPNILIGTGQTLTTHQVALLIKNKIGKGNIIKKPTRVGEEKTLPVYMKENILSQYTNWQPQISLEEGLNDTIEWYRQNNK